MLLDSWNSRGIIRESYLYASSFGNFMLCREANKHLNIFLIDIQIILSANDL